MIDYDFPDYEEIIKQKDVQISALRREIRDSDVHIDKILFTNRCLNADINKLKEDPEGYAKYRHDIDSINKEKIKGFERTIREKDDTIEKLARRVKEDLYYGTFASILALALFYFGYTLFT
jgi:predicted RNase H-like nuclease (RuvC/YqgF family)